MKFSGKLKRRRDGLHPANAAITSLIAAAALFYCPVYCGAQTPAGRSRDVIGSRINEQRHELEEVRQQEAGALERLDAIDQQLIRDRQHFDELTDSLATLQNKIKVSQERIEKLKKDRHKNEQALKLRLVAAYKFYKRGYFDVFFSTPSYISFLRQEHYLQHVLMNDQDLFSESLRLIEAETSVRNTLVAQRSELETVKESLQAQREAVEKSKKDKTLQLAAVRNEKTALLSALAELEKYAADMQNLVEGIPSDGTVFLRKDKKFTCRRGSLPMPVKGKIISRFGRKLYPGLQTTTFQKGIDIDCRSGIGVKSVFGGRVVYAGWFKGYGNTMIVDHGESYYSLIAHSSKLLKNVGDVVSEGEVIALSGDTGSLSGPMLHFEIRYHGKPQDPLLWLRHENL